NRHDCFRRFLFDGGSPGNADGEGGKAHSTGIGPVHLEWTIVDGGSFPPSHGDYCAVIETRQTRRSLRANCALMSGLEARGPKDYDAPLKRGVTRARWHAPSHESSR